MNEAFFIVLSERCPEEKLSLNILAKAQDKISYFNLIAVGYFIPTFNLYTSSLLCLDTKKQKSRL